MFIVAEKPKKYSKIIAEGSNYRKKQKKFFENRPTIR